MEFKLNGNTIPYEGDPEMSLMTYLRDEEGIISPKDGCAPEGVCGCCTVLMDGNPLKACIAPMRRIEGKGWTAVRILYSRNHHENLAPVQSAIFDRKGS